MEPTNSTTKIWLLVAGTTLGMILFAGLYFSTPKAATPIQAAPNFVTNTVVSIVTNEVVKEIPKEVEKIVKVPAEIPEEYASAFNLYQRITNASFVGPDQVLYNMKDIRAVCVIDDAAKQVLSQDEVKAKFELTLRRNNIPLNPNSLNVVIFSISSFFDTQQTTLCYSLNCSVNQRTWIFRTGECHETTVTVWTKGNSFGTVGKSKANDALLNEVEKVAEIFANDFLSANPKQ